MFFNKQQIIIKIKESNQFIHTQTIILQEIKNRELIILIALKNLK